MVPHTRTQIPCITQKKDLSTASDMEITFKITILLLEMTLWLLVKIAHFGYHYIILYNISLIDEFIYAERPLTKGGWDVMFILISFNPLRYIISISC